MGQKASVPSSTFDLGFSNPSLTGISKYTSSFHKVSLPSKGSLRSMASMDLGAKNLASSPSASPRFEIEKRIFILEISVFSALVSIPS